MSLEEARQLVDAGNATVRLLALDDLWTEALQSGVEQQDRLALIAVGSEMGELLERLRGQAPSLGEVVLRDRKAFESMADDVVRAAPIPVDQKRMIVEFFHDLGWAAEAEVAFRHLAFSEEEGQELSRKINELSDGLAPVGDLRPWFRCSLFIVVAALGIGTALVTGGASVTLGMAVLQPVMQLGLDLDGCRDKKHVPSEAEQLEQWAQLRDRSRITEEEYQEKKRQILHPEPDHREPGLREHSDVASAALAHDLPVRPPLQFPRKGSADSARRGKSDSGTPSDR